MDLIDPAVMLREVEALGDDVRSTIEPLGEQLRVALTSADSEAVKHVYLVGAGDSYHASRAAEMAFASLAGVSVRPMSALRFLEYDAAWMPHSRNGRPLVVAVSASGATPRVLQAVKRAREQGALTLALTGAPGSPITDAACRTVVVELAHKERSPGIRTHQASLVALLVIAVRLHETRRHDLAGASSLREELIRLASCIDATAGACGPPSRGVAHAIADSPTLVVAGSGPSYGAALHGAAKIVEATGVHARAQDLEEWWHVDRFAYPDDMPVFVIAPPGRSQARAVQLAETARALGRRVIAVAHEHDVGVSRHAHMALPVAGETREEFSPLLYGVFAGQVASCLAAALGRAPFKSDRLKPPAGPTWIS
jgi:glutamine---fructose-6-phosphate transaminase (isomerizing)